MVPPSSHAADDQLTVTIPLAGYTFVVEPGRDPKLFHVLSITDAVGHEVTTRQVPVAIRAELTALLSGTQSQYVEEYPVGADLDDAQAVDFTSRTVIPTQGM